MVAVSEPNAVCERVDAPSVVAERLEAFAVEVLAAAMNRPVQMVNGEAYLRGLLEQGPRKSLEPLVARLGGDARTGARACGSFGYDSPWDLGWSSERLAWADCPVIGVEAWVLDDTGFPKDGKRSPWRWALPSTRGRWGRPGTVRSGCRCTRSGCGGRCRWGGRCICPRIGVRTRSGGAGRRSPRTSFSRPSQSLVSSWSSVPAAGGAEGAVLGDSALWRGTPGCAIASRRVRYVLCVGPKTKVFEQGTTFAVPAKKPGASRGPVRPRPDRQPADRPRSCDRLQNERTTEMIRVPATVPSRPFAGTWTSAWRRVQAGCGWRARTKWTGWRNEKRSAAREEMADRRMALA